MKEPDGFRLHDDLQNGVISYNNQKMMQVVQERAMAANKSKESRNDTTERSPNESMNRHEVIQKAKQAMRKTHGPTNRVRLNIYDLLKDTTSMPMCGVDLPIGQIFNTCNNGMNSLGTGAYHVGVQVNGIEYAYGANDISGATGVFCHEPRKAPGFQYRTFIDLGERTAYSRVQTVEGKSTYAFVDGRKILHAMAKDYMGQDYDLLRKNCCTFAIEACMRLGIKSDEIPTWFRNLAETGRNVQDVAYSTIEPVAEACGDLEALSARLLIRNA